MPTIVLLDVSLSMRRHVSVAESGEEYQLRQLAIHGINTLLDHLTAHCKLEFVALVAYSSLYEVVHPFTRDLEAIKAKLTSLEEVDKTCVGSGLQGVNQLVLEEWGSNVPCQVVLVTDGGPGIGPHSLTRMLSSWESGSEAAAEPHPLPFGFAARLSVMCLGQTSEPEFQRNQAFFRRLLELAGGEGAVYVPQALLSPKSVQAMFQEMCVREYESFRGVLHCGSLKAQISLCPPPQPYCKAHDFEVVKCSVSEDIMVCGFFEMADVASPAALSRHLVLPLGSVKGDVRGDGAASKLVSEVETEDDVTVDDGKVASLCVLLHGALKIENMAALCQVADDWYGIMYSWADNRKKSNLMLSVFEPGSHPIPWLGDLRRVGPISENLAGLPDEEPANTFPVRSSEKRSYSQNSVVWIRQMGIQSDIQKILRHARKLPEKTQQFYKELNRIRRAAVALGFHELLDGLAAIFERECTLLPGSAHPDCALQLTHAAGILRHPQSRDIKFTIMPMHTKYRSDD